MYLPYSNINLSNFNNKNNKNNKCIVLDVDETLVHTFHNIDDYYNLDIFNNPDFFNYRDSFYNFQINNIPFAGVVRPYCKQFLSYCFNNFDVVAIWSAGKYDYVHNIVEHLFSDLPDPTFIFTFDNCVNYNNYYTKPLSLMFDKHNFMCSNNTIIVDDRSYSFDQVNPSNGLLIPGYNPSTILQDLIHKDNTLLKLINFFNSKDFNSISNFNNININNFNIFS